MKLILMRHAKSDWSMAMADKERPLNGRGRRSAVALGDWLRSKEFLPDHVLCSSAKRTQETLAGLKLNAPVSVLPSLYLADPATILSELHACTSETVLVVAHNPGIAALAHQLAQDPPSHPRFRDYPTCATLVTQFDVDTWQDISPATGTVVDFAVGRDFTD